MKKIVLTLVFISAFLLGITSCSTEEDCTDVTCYDYGCIEHPCELSNL